MKHRTAAEAEPNLRDSRYQAERIVATAAASILRRQNTAFLSSRNSSRSQLDRIARHHHLVLTCAVELDRAYLALEAAARRVTARIDSIDPHLIGEHRIDAHSREAEPADQILVRRVVDAEPSVAPEASPILAPQSAQVQSDERHAA